MKRLRSKLGAITVFAVLMVSMLPVLSPVVHAYTVPNTNSVGWTGVASNTLALTVANIGDLITLEIQISDGANAAKTSVSVLSVTDSQTNVYALAIQTQVNIAPNCLAGNCFDNEIWYATSKATGADTITIILSQATVIVNAEAQDVAGITVFLKSTATGNAATGMAYSTTTSLAFNAGDYAVSSIWTNCAAAGTLTAGTGYILQGNIAPFDGAAEYGNPASPPTSPTNFPYTCTINSRWIDNGAVFGVSNIQFDFTITNFDLGNYLVVQLNKFYLFNATVKDLLGVNINVMKWKWTDGANTAEVQYSNVTKLATILQGNNIIFIGTATATSSKVGSTVKLNVIIPVRLSEIVLDATNVSVNMFGQLADGTSRGYVVVKPNYFNILNQGGSTSTIASGLCSQTPGSPIYGAVCQNKGWLMTNTTWFQLQSYHTEFAINLNGDFGAPDTFLFQDFANSNAGAEHYSQAGDWKVDIGWFYFNNGAWMKGFHMTLQMSQGNQGVQDQWTQLRVLQYNGKNTLIANDTSNVFSSWIEQSPRSQIRLWVDLWISNLNASSMHGMRAGAYYYAIHQSGFTFFGSWSPFLQNASSVLRFAKNIDSTGKTLAGQQIVYSKLYYNISRGHQPAGQANFQIITKDFNIEEFKRTKGQMEGVATPILVDARIPTLPVDGFLAPLYAAITNIGNFIWSALAAAFAAIWAQLAIRFPWFTGFFDTINSAVVNFVNLFIVIIGYLAGFLSFLFSVAGFISGPITIISTAWNFIVSIYNGIFKGADPFATITLLIIITFGLSALEAVETGDWPFLIKMARQTWAIANAIMFWAFWLAKALIDAVLAIIP